MIGQNKLKHTSNSELISIQDGISQASSLINPRDAALALLNRQTGLPQTVKDISITELHANSTIPAKLATLMNLSVITTALAPDGPLVPEVRHAAQHAFHVPLRAELNAWHNDMFIEAIRKTGKNTLIISATGGEGRWLQSLRRNGRLRGTQARHLERASPVSHRRVSFRPLLTQVRHEGGEN